MVELRPLTMAESKRPYAKYYTRPMTPPADGIYEDIANPADPALALSPHNINDLLKPGPRALERGWCELPDGSFYLAGYADMPGVSTKMLEWWFAWHGLESLRYMIWDPDDHFAVNVKPDTIARRFDTGLSWRERNWNTTDIVVEDVGTGVVTLEISFLSPEAVGYDMKKFNEGGFAAINANICLQGHDQFVSFSHNARPTKTGVELRSCFWIGWIVENGQRKRVAKDAPRSELTRLAQGLSRHCTKEYHNLAAILPFVYEENHGIIDKPEDFI